TNEVLQNRMEDSRQLDQAKIPVHEFPIDSTKARDLCALLRISPNHSNTSKRLLRTTGDSPEVVLNFFESIVNSLRKVISGADHERHRHKRKQRKPPAYRSHQRHNQSHSEHGVQRVHQRRTNYHADRRQVVGRTSHQITSAVSLIEAE